MACTPQSWPLATVPSAFGRHYATCGPRRASNAVGFIESPFATVRLRQRVTKGAGSRLKGLLMVFGLLAMAEQRWRWINGAHLIPLLRTEETFVDGARAERKSAA